MTPYHHICFLVPFFLACPRPGLTAGPRGWTTYQNMNYVTSFAEGDREVYVGTTGGVRRFDLFTGHEGKPLTTAEGLRDNRVLRMAYDRRMGDLYVDTPAGVDRWGIETDTVFPSAQFPSQPASEAHVPNGGFPLDSLLLQPGLFLQDGWIRDRHFRTYRVTGYLFDRWSHIWVGTWGLGVGMADIRQRILNLMPYGPAENNVTAFLADGDDLWIGGLEGSLFAVEARDRGLRDTRVGDARGITRHSRRDGTWTTYEPGEVFGLDEASVFSIISDEANIWFATQDGLVRYEKGNGIWRTYRDFQGIRGTEVTDAIRDGDRLWIGTPTGLGLLDVASDSTVSISGGKSTYVYDMVRTGGFLWAATNRGVFRCPEGKASWSLSKTQKAIFQVRSRLPVRRGKRSGSACCPHQAFSSWTGMIGGWPDASRFRS